MKTVHEFKAQRNEQRHEQQDEGQIGGRLHPRRAGIGIDAVGDIEQGDEDRRDESDRSDQTQPLVEVRPAGVAFHGDRCIHSIRPLRSVGIVTKFLLGRVDDIQVAVQRAQGSTDSAWIGNRAAPRVIGDPRSAETRTGGRR